MKDFLPAEVEQEQATGFDTDEELWLRVTAFLDQKSPNTQRTYVGIIKEWCDFLGAQPGTSEAARRILQANDLHAMAYKKWLQQRPGQRPRLKQSSSDSLEISSERSNESRDGLQTTLSNSTIAKKFAALRRLYRMFINSRLGSLSQNPFDTDKVPTPAARAGQKRPTEMCDFSKVRDVLQLPDRSTPKGLRDLAILCVLFGGGLRRSEVTKIRIGDVKRTPEGTLYLRLRATKAKRDADQALPAWADEAITHLVQARTSAGAKSGDILFVSYRGQGGMTATEHPLSDSGLYRLFKRYCQLAGAGEFLSPHSARATAITKLLALGLGHREVQEFSRHASVQMVEVYDKRRISVDESPANKLEF